VTPPNGMVLDASAALGWLLNDVDAETREEIDHRLAQGFALVPELWHCEVSNALRTSVRRGLIDRRYVDSACMLLEKLDIRTDVVGSPVRRLTDEALHHDLTSYDVTYLLLARDRGLPLATLDQELSAAAARAGVPLVLSS